MLHCKLCNNAGQYSLPRPVLLLHLHYQTMSSNSKRQGEINTLKAKLAAKEWEITKLERRMDHIMQYEVKQNTSEYVHLLKEWVFVNNKYAPGCEMWYLSVMTLTEETKQILKSPQSKSAVEPIPTNTLAKPNERSTET